MYVFLILNTCMLVNMYKLIYIYLFIIISYKSSITNIEHSSNYTSFGLPLTHQMR